MYITLQEIATKFNMTEVETLTFSDYVMTNHRSLVLTNPDLSASTVLEAHIMKDSYEVRTIVCDALSRDDVKTTKEIELLRLNAVNTVATFFAEYNKANFEDFVTDMRLEKSYSNDTMCPRSLFMSDLDTITDIVDNLLLNEVVALLPNMQS